MRRRGWRRGLVGRECLLETYVEHRTFAEIFIHDIQAIEKMIASWGLPWTYRFVGLATLILGVVRHLKRSGGLSPLTFCPTLSFQPAAYVLRPGYSRPSRSTTTDASRDSETTAVTEVPEKSIFRSSKYTRILVAWLVASYPFLIPPYVSPGGHTDIRNRAEVCLLASSLVHIPIRYVPHRIERSGSLRELYLTASSIGLSSSQGALYSALFNIASAIGRLAYGFLADYAIGVCVHS